MFAKVLPNLPTLALAIAFFFLIVALKVALARGYARRYLAQEGFVTTVALVFNVAVVPVLLALIFNADLARYYTTALFFAVPLFLLLEAAAYHYMAQVRARPAATLAVAVNLVQVAAMAAAVLARDAILV
jgi:hypothetical protein